jgi:hypothetical protein
VKQQWVDRLGAVRQYAKMSLPQISSPVFCR